MSGQDDRELERRIAKLPRSIEPERDLWNGIAERIGAKRSEASFAARRKKLVFAGVGSLVAMAAAVTLVATGRIKRPAWPWPSPAPTAVVIAGDPTVSPAPSAAPLAEPPHPLENAKERIAYRTAVAELEASLAESRPNLPNDAAKRIDESLGVIDHAIEATEQAIAKDPESIELRSQLWDEYQQKIDALTAVVDLVTRTS